jgi:hypothetical protein
MRFGGIVLAVLLTLGACSSDPEPKEPKRTATSATPTATPPTMPAQAKEDTPEGAAAFVKHYIDVFNYASNTGDVEELSRLSSPACKGCQSYIKLYRDTYKAGGYIKGSDWTLGDLRLQQDDTTTYVTTIATTEPGPYKQSRNTPERKSTGKDNKVSFAVERVASRWQLSQLGLGDVR